MPAVTVSDVSVLPALEAPSPGARIRPVVSRTQAPHGLEGEGFPVKRAFAGVDLRLLDPFIMMDEMGEVDYAPGEPKGTPWHPHRGFETVTYIIDGTFVHADSFGGGGTITNGATQWMTAGSGILHIEAPPEDLVTSGGRFHGLQLWVNLPRRDKLATPRYQDLGPGDVTLVRSPDGGALVRVIAGEVGGRSGGHSGGYSVGHRGPGATHTPITMLHATLAPGARLDLPWRADFNALVYVMGGAGAVGVMGGVGMGGVGAGGAGAMGAHGSPISTGQLAVLGEGDTVTVSADLRQETRYAAGLEVIVLGGAPIREPIAWAGPFVMNTRAELVEAFEDYRAGRLGQRLGSGGS